MGQYYKAVIQATDYDKLSGERIRKQFVLCPHSFGDGLKLNEHTYIGSMIVRSAMAIIHHLNKQGWVTQLVWLGDYHSPFFGENTYLYESVYNNIAKIEIDGDIIKVEGIDDLIDLNDHRFIVNTERNEYVDMHEYNGEYHPLALLTADGNGKGGGDYFKENWREVGRWRYNTISVMDEEGFLDTINDPFLLTNFRYQNISDISFIED